MDQKRVCLTVPAEPGFARIVRMTAASLAVTCDMGVDEVEDARMAAEEGFVYACATGQQECGIVFGISDEAVTMDFSLGEDLGAADADESLELVEALLAAICYESSISEDGRTLSLTKRTGGAHDE